MQKRKIVKRKPILRLWWKDNKELNELPAFIDWFKATSIDKKSGRILYSRLNLKWEVDEEYKDCFIQRRFINTYRMELIK